MCFCSWEVGGGGLSAHMCVQRVIGAREMGATTAPVANRVCEPCLPIECVLWVVQAREVHQRCLF